MKRTRRVACVAIAGTATLLLLAAPAARASESLWNALEQGGHVVLLRHAATVPGNGDPPGFRLDDCRTQRNLSAGGRHDAQNLGAEFRRRKIAVHEVLASEWCRCRDTAHLAFGSSRPWPALNSFFDNPAGGNPSSDEVRRRIAAFRGPGTLVLVTHQVNITALTGLVPAPGEMLVIVPTPAGGRALGRLPPAAPLPTR
ncbi:MAG: histidine phosphatase family protein [Burkholderiales bacterium]